MENVPYDTVVYRPSIYRPCLVASHPNFAKNQGLHFVGDTA